MKWSAVAPSGIEGCASAGDSGRLLTVREVRVVRVALDARLRTARARDLQRDAFSTILTEKTVTRKNVYFHDM